MNNSNISFHSATPILRIFNVKKAREFYLDFLGFRLDWEHRFEHDLPLYMQLSLGNIVIHLSEHHGDATPGSAVRVETAGIKDYHKVLSLKRYTYARPELERTPWGTKEMCLTDPFGNRLLFYEKIENE